MVWRETVAGRNDYKAGTHFKAFEFQCCCYGHGKKCNKGRWDEFANAGDSPRWVATPSPWSGRKIVSWFHPCLALTCTAFDTACDLSVVFPHSESPYPSTTASISWRDRRYREINVVSSWGPPTQFSLVRKFFLSRKLPERTRGQPWGRLSPLPRVGSGVPGVRKEDPLS